MLGLDLCFDQSGLPHARVLGRNDDLTAALDCYLICALEHVMIQYSADLQAVTGMHLRMRSSCEGTIKCVAMPLSAAHMRNEQQLLTPLVLQYTATLICVIEVASR